VIFGGKKVIFSRRKTWLETVAEGGFQMFHSAFRVKPDSMHLAVWLCSRVKFFCRNQAAYRGGVPFLPGFCPGRGEPFRGGAGNGRCGK